MAFYIDITSFDAAHMFAMISSRHFLPFFNERWPADN